MQIPPMRPGLESLAPFTLKKVEDKEEIDAANFSLSRYESQVEKECISSDDSKTVRSLRRRPWINNGSSDKSGGSESESKKVLIPRRRLPQGVIRGCRKCDDCQKVIAKWCPEEACRPDLEEAPVFYPTEKEFEDTLKYIASIRSTAEAYGICRIVPPDSWRPPCPLKQQQTWENTKFTTRVQRIDELQNRYSMRKKSKNKHQKRKRRCMEAGEDGGCYSEETKAVNDAETLDDEEFGFEPGPDFTLHEFQAYAQDFKTQYFRKSNSTSNRRGRVYMSQGHCDPSVEDIEGEYWRMVQRPTERIEVLYGADLETGVFSSGFPKNSDQVDSASDVKYVNSGWNLNNFPRLPGSILSYECSDISGVLVPWLYVGMCFSSFCWHVEDHHLYSLNYMHWGEPKIWYGVPAADALKLEETMRKHLPDLFEEQPDLLHKLVTQLSPSILRNEEVPIYRCVQNPGEFVLTFPRAYHAGFNCGFNCAEAVNVAPVDWLPHGQNAVEVYREEGRKTTISHDKLLLGAAKDAVKACWEISLLKKITPDNLRWMDVCGKDGMLFKALESRVQMENARRESLCKSSQTLKMESSFDATTERECSVCFYDLHLSAAGCHNCSPDKYACLNHARKLCSCSWGAKFFLFRYDEKELNMLVEALGGKLCSTYRWARKEGITLTSYKSENSLVMNTDPILNIENERGKEDSLNSSKVDDVTCLIQRDKPPGESPTPQDMKGCSGMRCSSDEIQAVRVRYQCKEESPSDSGTPMCRENVKFVGNSNHKPEKTKPTFKGNTEAIFLSEHEAENLSPKPERKDLVWGGKRARTLAKAANKSIRLNQQDSFSIQLMSSKEDVEKNECISSQKETNHCNVQMHPLQGDADLANNGSGPQTLDNIRNALADSAGTSNNFDGHLVNCNVEPQEFGVVQAGKLWCDAGAIYPKGFRSRVRYISVVDPTSMCYYVSEIIDDGHDRPLFMVSLEDSPDKVFVDVSAAKSWEIVRERVNKEILYQHTLRTPKLYRIQIPGSLDGMEMFGLTSPAILQVIQAMDHNRVCTEYWKSRPSMQQVPDSHEINIVNFSLEAGESNHQQNIKSHQSDMRVSDIIDGVLKKASREELHAMRTILNSIDSTMLLNKEIEQRLR